ncbi:MAG: WG repeat-containing protein [Neisseria sp.]|nr:WG repeat-containing protein [Neisseria sp.]
MKKNLPALMLPLLLAACASSPALPAQADHPLKSLQESWEQMQPRYGVLAVPADPACDYDPASRFGLLDDDGSWLLPPQYSLLYPLSYDNTAFQPQALARLQTLYLAATEPIRVDKQAYVSEYCVDYAKAQGNTVYPLAGVINQRGEWLVEPSLKIENMGRQTEIHRLLAQRFPDELQLATATEADDWRRLNEKLAQQYEGMYLDIPRTESGTAVFVQGGGEPQMRYGLIRQNGSWVVSPQEAQWRGYTQIQAANALSALKQPLYVFGVEKNGDRCFGMLNGQGEEVLPADFGRFYRVSDQSGGVRVAVSLCDGSRKGFISQQADGSWQWLFTLPQAYEHLDIASDIAEDGSFRVRSETRLNGRMNLAGKLLLPVRFRDLDEFDADGYAAATDADRRGGIINRKGKWLAGPQAGRAARLPNSNWVEYVQEDGGKRRFEYGRLGSGKTDAPFVDKGIELVWGFDQQGYGLARRISADRTQMLRQEGFVNQAGEWLIAPEYSISAINPDNPDNRETLQQLLQMETASKIYANNLIAYFNTAFNRHNRLVAEKNGKKGVIDRKGRVIVPFEYDKITLTDMRRYILAYKQNSVTVYGLKGEVKIQP